MTAREVLAAAVLVVVLVGCAPDPPHPSPTPSPTINIDPADPATIRSTGLPLTSGAVTLSVTATSPEVTPADDGSVHLTTPGGDALIASPEGLTVTALGDGSGVVRDAAGAFVAGLAPEPWGTRLTQVSPEVVRLTGAGATPGPAGVWFAAVVVDSAVWGTAEGGRSLAVTPAAWGRVGSLAAQEGLWAQVVALAPDADTPGMQAQLECHELGAPDKATWNLEPWRPVVSGLDMIAARCNPT